MLFRSMSFDKEEVQCFSFIKDIVDREYDTNDILREKKEKMYIQLIEAFEWLESLNVRIEYKNMFLSYLDPNSNNLCFKEKL